MISLYTDRFSKIWTGKFACTAVSALPALIWADQALASQGPGAKPGTASGFTQLAMAILVYGTSAVVIGIGLIGAARRH